MKPPSEGTILVVDDDPLITRTLEALLQAETSWTVQSFNRPTAARDALNDRVYDAVVCDFLMPEMDGLQFLRCVREQQPAASRILLTGYADRDNAIRSINEVGLYHYLEKPWDNEALLLVLRNAVDRTQLVREMDSLMQRLVEKDRSLEELRVRLFKAVL